MPLTRGIIKTFNFKTMPTRLTKSVTALNAVTATGASAAIENNQFRHPNVVISTADTTTATIKIQGSLQETAPDFTAAASPTNKWDYVATYNLNNPTSVITGDTGIAYTGTDAVEQLIVNVDGLKWVGVEVTAYTAGTITADVVSFDNT